MNTSTESGGTGDQASSPSRAKTPPPIDEPPVEPVNGMVIIRTFTKKEMAETYVYERYLI